MISEQIGEPKKTVFVPVPVPLMVPVPVPQCTMPTPYPLPMPIPVPVPCFVPTTKKLVESLMKQLQVGRQNYSHYSIHKKTSQTRATIFQCHVAKIFHQSCISPSIQTDFLTKQFSSECCSTHFLSCVQW